MNGHVDKAAQPNERVYGGFGHNGITEGENILKICIASDKAVGNTFSQKNPQHLITYSYTSHSMDFEAKA